MREIVVFVILQQHKKYTLSITKKNIFETLKYIFVYHFLLYLFICGFKFVIIETRCYDIAHDENAISTLIIQSID